MGGPLVRTLRIYFAAFVAYLAVALSYTFPLITKCATYFPGSGPPLPLCLRSWPSVLVRVATFIVMACTITSFIERSAMRFVHRPWALVKAHWRRWRPDPDGVKGSP